MNLGGPESIIVLVVVLLLFGVGRVSRIGGELGTAIREFRKGLAGEDEVKAIGEGTSETATVEQRDRQQAE
jgi:sec-independent protein translocase protein TatA